MFKKRREKKKLTLSWASESEQPVRRLRRLKSDCSFFDVQVDYPIGPSECIWGRCRRSHMQQQQQQQQQLISAHLFFFASLPFSLSLSLTHLFGSFYLLPSTQTDTHAHTQTPEQYWIILFTQRGACHKPSSFLSCQATTETNVSTSFMGHCDDKRWFREFQFLNRNQVGATFQSVKT